ncbi:hypothetical protein ACFVX9_00210 [Kitasatospora sp. NPDC058243]|uniref:hypothetical protein n=1 Tax=Kitasatospora sp. NPDC058243 TaxID=3346397 RepID=UPI0036D82D90
MAQGNDTIRVRAGLDSQLFDLTLLVSNVPQALLQAGEFAEPLHPLGLPEAAGVDLDLEQPGLLDEVETEHGAPDTGSSELWPVVKVLVTAIR